VTDQILSDDDVRRLHLAIGALLVDLPELRPNCWYRFRFDVVQLKGGDTRVNHVHLVPIADQDIYER
jgi:hypothetical protein